MQQDNSHLSIPSLSRGNQRPPTGNTMDQNYNQGKIKFSYQSNLGSYNQPSNFGGPQVSQNPYGGQDQNFGMNRPPTGNSFQNTQGYKKSVDEILGAMAKKIQDQHIMTLSEFFIQYDVYIGRKFSSWELAIIFMDSVTIQEADDLIFELNGRIGGQDQSVDYQTLVNQLQRKLYNIQPGQVGPQSVYIQKFKSQQVQNHLEHILTYFRQNGLSPTIGFDKYFNKSYITEQEFVTFLLQVNLRIQGYQEQQQLFEYFTIGSKIISKINFVQALNALTQTGPPSSYSQQPSYGNINQPSQLTGNPYQQQNSFSSQLPPGTPSNLDSPNLNKFISAAKSYMTSRNGLTFEGLLSHFNIPNAPYIETFRLEDLCKGMGLFFTPTEINQIVSLLDEDRVGKVKTQSLRLKLDLFLQSVSSIGGGGFRQDSYNNPPAPLQNQLQANNRMTPQVTQSNWSVPNYKLGNNPNLRSWLDRIKNVLQNLRIVDLSQQFQSATMLKGKVVVTLDEFLIFLRAPGLVFKENEAIEMSQEYIIQDFSGYKAQIYIDIIKFEKDVYQGGQQAQFIDNRQRFFDLVTQFNESAKKYVMLQGGNLVKFFQEMDLNKDNFVSKEEMKIMMQRIINRAVTDDEVQVVFSNLDNNQDGRISFSELCKKFSEFSNTKAIKDPTHWAFPFFESIRRISIQTGQSLAQLFGVQMNTMSQKVSISKDQFFRQLQVLRVPLYDDPIRILELLDADQAHQWEIDFQNFAELVGMNIDQSFSQNNQIKDYQKSPQDTLYYEKNRKFYKGLYKIMQSTQTSINILQLLFKRFDPANKLLISQQDFINVIQEIDQKRILDQIIIRDISDKFLQQVGGAPTVDYHKFVNRLEGEIEKYKFIDYLFLTIKSLMAQSRTQNLSDVFAKFDPAYHQKGFDKTTLERFLQSQGIVANQSELSLILIEYDPKGTGQFLDFNTFQLDFQEFCGVGSYMQNQIQSKQQLYKQYAQFSKDYSGYDMSKMVSRNASYNYFDSGPSQNTNQPQGFNQQNTGLNDSFGRPQSQQSLSNKPDPKRVSPQAQSVLDKIGRYLDSNPAFKFTTLLLEHDLTKSGVLSRDNFQSILGRGFMLTSDEIYHLMMQYDPMQRNSIKIQDFLNDIKEHVMTPQVKIGIVSVLSELDGANQTRGGPQSQLQSQNILQRYSKDFEEIQKAIINRKSDTFKWFEGFSRNRQTLTKDEFSQALRALNLTFMKPQDIDQIYEALDPQFRGSVDIYSVDEAIRKNVSQSGAQMKDELLEKIIRAYNGDDAFILQELSKEDKRGRGFINQSIFVDYFVRNSPSNIRFSQNDIAYLADNYIDTRIGPTDVDVNKFHSDLNRIKKMKGIPSGFYNPQIQGSNKLQNDKSYGTSGKTNALLPNYSKDNTVTAQNRIQSPPGFKINLQPRFLEEISKSTYVKEVLVKEHFQKFCSQGSQLYEADFQRAIQLLDLGWSAQNVQMVYNEIDKAFNNQRARLVITAEQVDQAVSFSMTKGVNFANEIASFDQRSQKQVSVDNMFEVLLNRLRIPQLNQQDVAFLCKKYIITVPNMVHYEKLLDDIQSVSRMKFSNIDDMKVLCDFIRKAILSNATTIEQHCAKYQKMKDITTKMEFAKAIEELDLVNTGICTKVQIDSLYNDIDQAQRGQITTQQINQHINNLSFKTIKDFQEVIMDDICAKAKSRNLLVDQLFKQDDPASKGYVTYQTFENLLVRQFVLKNIDARVIANKYKERGDNVNYRIFLSDYSAKERSLFSTQSSQAQQNNQLLEQVKPILKKIDEFAKQNRLQLSNAFSQYERGQSSGVIATQQFQAALNQLNLPLTNMERTILVDLYQVPQQQNQVSYLKFLEHLKLYGGAQGNSNQKTLQSLTLEQKNLYQGITKFLTQNNQINRLVDLIRDKDPNQKGYLPGKTIRDAFVEVGMKMSQKQFDLLYSALDTNQYAENNYKQLLDLLFGQEDANRMFSLAPGTSLNRQQKMGQARFVIPQQPINPSNSTMANIARRIIQQNINYEEEFKKMLSPQQLTSSAPRLTDNDILNVLRTCKVFFNDQERIEFEAFVLTNKDRNGMINLLDFLNALGLPAQTLGPLAEQELPKKILNQNELQECQRIISSLRKELELAKRTPQQVFEKLKQQTADISFPPITLKFTLGSEFGALGKQITDQQIELLTYYLMQEVPGQISFKKLYLAFTISDREPPLKQEGSDTIKRYATSIQEKAKQGVPFEVIDFVYFMKQQNLLFNQVFKSTQKGLIPVQEFDQALRDIGFKPKDMQKLIAALDVKQTKTSVSLDKLGEYIKKIGTSKKDMTPQMARDQYAGFDPKIRSDLQKISDFMKRSNITLQKMYDEMDINRDGTVDKQEFVNRLAYFNIPGIQLSDLGKIFDSIDINNDNVLSVHEFGLFIEGAKASRMQRVQELDPKMIEDMKKEISTLFQSFDEDKNGYVTADELFKSMLALGQRITLQDAKDMISNADQNSDGKVDLREFIDLMLPKMKEELLNQEESMEDLRAMFLEADIDHSGTLSIDEIYSVILKLGAEVTMEELVELMNEIDVDRDGSLDIDEFIALMNMGDDLQFRSNNSKKTFLNIKKARKLNPMDFFRCFKNMPMNFVPSMISEKWLKFKKNLPSSVFKPQIDPKTMLYQDLLPVLSENIPPSQNQKAYQPRVRPIPTELGAQITLEGCEGVPMPSNQQGFDRNQIVKRAVRIGLYDTLKKDFIYNSIQVNAVYNQTDEDIWGFNAQSDAGTNPVLFKTGDKDELCKPHIFIVFELVIYVKFGDKISEMCCGWCQLDVNAMDRQMSHKLPIKGGSPSSELIIKDQDVHTKRSGVKQIIKMISSKINSQLTVNIRPHTKFTDETKFHLDLLPTTCFIQKRLLFIVSGFRNYTAEKLLKQSSMGTFKHPEGDVIISSFPKIIDSIDIVELLIQIWHEDVMASIPAKQKLNIEFIMMKTKEYIQKLYPVLYSEEFKYRESNPTHSASGDQYLMRKREDLIKSALRFGSTNAKTRFEQPLEALTTFKPFTVKELEYEVWDTNQSKQDRFMKQYEELGLVRSESKPNTPVRGMSQVNIFGQGQQQNPYGGSGIGYQGQPGIQNQQLGYQNQQQPLNPLSLENAMNSRFNR